MLNLLPNNQKQEIIKEYKLRRFAVVILLLSALGIVCLLLVIPSYVLSNIKESEVSSQIDSLSKNLAAQNTSALESQVAVAEKKLVLLNQKETVTTASSFIKEVVNTREKAVSISALRYTNLNGEVAASSKKTAQPVVGSFTLEVGGVAGDREQLVDFANRLRTISGVDSVDLPLSSLAQDQNIIFTLTITGILQ